MLSSRNDRASSRTAESRSCVATSNGLEMPEAIAVMVHGILSSSTTWSSLVRCLKEDDQVSHLYEFDPFDYPSPKARLLPTRRTPDYDTLADSLGTYLEVECAEYPSVALVGHSQGGLIIQRYLARMLSDGRGDELQKIRRIVMLACPSNGSEFLLLARRALPLLRNVQERALRPLEPDVMEALRKVFTGIVHATEVTSTSCPIPVVVYVAEEDNIVKPASARSVFPDAKVLPGDHTSILQADSVRSRVVRALRRDLLMAVGAITPASGLVSTPLAILDGPTGSDLKLRYKDADGSEMEIFDHGLASQWIKIHSGPTAEETKREDEFDDA